MKKAGPIIAIVDDDEPVRKALQRLLRSAGMAAETFPSGEVFLASLPTSRPACVVLDLHMPRVTGFDVLKRMTEGGFDVPVIVFTGHDSPEAYEKALALGALTYLRKPVNDEALLEAVRQAVGGEALT